MGPDSYPEETGYFFSAATAKPTTENANATAIPTAKIFFISFSLPSFQKPPGKPPLAPPHWRQAFPNWGIGQEGRIPNFFNR